MLIMRWLTLHLGRPCSRLILVIIVAYYLAFTCRGKRASRQFLQRALPRPPSIQDLLKHAWYFANTILDRVYMVSNQTQRLNIEVINAEIVSEHLTENLGCILLGSHLGSFEILRCLAQQLKNLPLNIVMDTGPNEQFNRHLYALNPDIQKSIINASEKDSIFKIDQALKQGQMIGMLGDRVTNQDRMTSCDFLGKPAHFPTGPFLIASIFEAPIILFFGVYLGGNRYRIIFELFSRKFSVERQDRDQAIKAQVQAYAQRLEYYTKQYPYNWFNFYDFWRQDDTP